jgi:hypothetical protein
MKLPRSSRKRSRRQRLDEAVLNARVAFSLSRLFCRMFLSAYARRH